MDKVVGGQLYRDLGGDSGRGLVTTSPAISTDSDFTGIITIPSAGTPVVGGDISCVGGFMLKGHPSNSKPVWLFKSGGTKDAGYPLSAGECVFINVANLSHVGFDSEVNGEKVCWAKV